MASRTRRQGHRDPRRPRWQDVQIVDCGEPLVALAHTGRILVCPIYEALGYAGAPDRVFLRTSVITRLRQAAADLPDNLRLLVWDGWRPLDLQRRLYDEYRGHLIKSSGLTGDELDSLVQRFVSEPSPDAAQPPPHATGGAVDLTLCDADGTAVDMGGAFDELSDRSSTSFYDGKRDIASIAFAGRRRLLFEAMVRAGFTNFPSEWWHFDYGNQFWARERGELAIYGRADPSDFGTERA